MSACAPTTGGYGFSAPTGYAPLVDIGRRWQDVDRHPGGVFEFEILPTSMSMSGGFGGSAYRKDWEFHIDRLSGDAVLSIAKEFAETPRKPEIEGKTAYTCQKSPRKF
jgi:hypothetical protein